MTNKGSQTAAPKDPWLASETFRERARLLEAENQRLKSAIQKARRLLQGEPTTQDLDKAHDILTTTTEGAAGNAQGRLEAENERLLSALQGLLLSRDAAWERDDRGHDWKEAVEAAIQAYKKAHTGGDA